MSLHVNPLTSRPPAVTSPQSAHIYGHALPMYSHNHASQVSGYAPFGAAYGAGPNAVNGGLYGVAVPPGHGYGHPDMARAYGYGVPHHGYQAGYTPGLRAGGVYGGFGGFGFGRPYGYGDHSIVHTDRVANTVRQHCTFVHV